MIEPQFPPLFSGQNAAGGDPFAMAIAAAEAGCDAGRVIYDLGADALRAAIVFAPDVPLSQAVAILPICGVSFQNAIGALGPPEVAVQLGWDGWIYVNGGRCGLLHMAASGTADVVPDWLVVALSLSLWPASDEMGHTPEDTALYAEGCAEIDPVELLQSWLRHTLVGINAWAEEGTAQLHRNWEGLSFGLDEDATIDGQTGRVIGFDEAFGLLLKTTTKTVSIPMTANLRRPQ